MLHEMQHPAYTAMEPNWSLIPPHMIGGLRRYIENGIPPGHFLAAVLSNDLFEALGRADSENQHRLLDYARFLYNYAPAGCYGSPNIYAAWLAKGGLGWSEIYQG